MSEPIDVGKLQIPVEMDLEPAFGARAKDQRRRLAEDAGVDTGNAFGRAYRKAFGKKQGDDSAKEFLAGAKLRFDRDMGDAKEALARGLTDRRTFDEAGKKAAKAYDDALLAEIKRRADAGKLDDKTFVALTSRLKLAGTRGGTQFGRGVQDASQRGLRGLVTAVRGLFLVQILGIMTRATGAMVRMWRQAGQALVSLVERGYQVDKVTQSFNRLAIAAGSVPDKVLTGLRRATRGMVTDMALMERANMAFQAGLPGTADQLEHLAYVSRRLADAQGRDATDAFNRMVNAIAKKERRLLDELGIIVSATDANKKYADQIGKNAKELTQAEKVQAFYNEVLAKADEKVKELGGETNDAGVTFAFLKTQIANALNETAELVAKSPTLARIMGDIATNTDKAGDAVDRYAAKFAAMVETALQVAEKLKGSWVAKALGWEVEKGAQLVGLGDIGQMYQQNYQAIRTRQAQEYLDREERVRQTADARRIRAEKDINALTKEREDTAKKINALTDKMLSGKPTQKQIQDVKRLGELVAVIDARIKELTPQATPLTKDQLRTIEAAKKALEDRMRSIQELRPLGTADASLTPDFIQKAVQHAEQMHEQVDAVKKSIKELVDTQQQVPAGTRQMLHAYESLANVADEKVKQLVADVAAIMKTNGIDGIVDADSLDKIKSMLDLYDKMQHRTVGAVATTIMKPFDAQDVEDRYTRKLADLGEQFARGLINPDEYERLAKEAAEALNKQLLALEDELNRKGLLTPQLKAQIDGLLHLDVTADSLKHFNDVVEATRNVTSSLGDLANELGEVGAEASEALRGLQEFLNGLGTMKAGAQKGGVLGTLGEISGIVGMAAGVAGIVTSLLGHKQSEAEQAAAQQEAERLKDLQQTQENNIQALNRLRSSVDALKDAYLDAQGGPLAAAQKALGPTIGKGEAEVKSLQEEYQQKRQELLDQRTGYNDSDIEKRLSQLDAEYKQKIEEAKREALNAMQAAFQAAGLNMGELQKIADGFHITLDGTYHSWQTFWDAIKGADFAQIAKSWQGALDLLHRAWDVFQTDDPTEKLKEFRSAFDAFIGDDLKKQLDSFDLSTADGRKGLQAFLQSIISGLQAGTFDPSQLGDLTMQQFLDAISEFAGLASGEGGVTTGGDGSTRMSVSITEVQANTMLALDTTRNYLLQQILSRLGGPVPGIVAASASITPPSPASLGLARGGATQVMVDMRGLTLPPIHISAPEGPTDLAGWEQAGKKLQQGLSRGFAGALTDALQGSGIDRARLQQAVGRR